MSNNLPDSLFGLPIKYTDELKTPSIRLGEWEEQSAKALVEKTDDGFDATCVEFPQLTAHGDTAENAVRALATMLQDFVNDEGE